MYLRNIHKYGLALIAAAGMASCSDDATTVASGEDTIVFKAQLMQSAGNDGWTAGNRVAILADGTTYTYTMDADGSMTADGTALVWKGTDMDIKAWTPIVDQTVSIADQTTADRLAACDFLAAQGSVTSRYMFIMFDHRMTRLTWDLRHVDESYTEQQVRDARITLLGYGTVDFINGDVTPAGTPDVQISTLESVNAGTRQGDAIMAPADMWGRPLVRIEIGGDEYYYTPDRANSSDVASAAGDLVAGRWQKYHLSISRKSLSVVMESTDVEWGNIHEFGEGDIADAKLLAEIAADVTDKPGYTVTGLDNGYIIDRTAGFTISYTEDALGGLNWTGVCTVTRIEMLVAGSTTATTHTYSFTDVKSDIEVSYLAGVDEGDYVYDNGAWGKEENREGCKDIGRVFHVGLDSRDDSSYGLCKIRGYVVPLVFGNTDRLKWFVNQADTQYIDALADIPVSADKEERESYYGGYLLTGLLATALEPFAAEWAVQVPFWYAFKNIDMQAPALTSGWYIPTYAQLRDVCASKLYDRFSDVYWSSQVYPGTGNAAVGGVEDGVKNILWAIRCGADQAVGYGWVIDEAKLLPILTF